MLGFGPGANLPSAGVPYPSDFEPFYDRKNLGQGTFGKVFEARVKGGYLEPVPKGKSHYHRIGPSIYQLKRYRYRLQTNSEKLQRW